MGNREEHQQRQQDRARAALARVEAQSETLGTSAAARAASANGAHDAQEDRIEVWGRRIGRGLGVAFMIYLLGYFFLGWPGIY